MGDPTAGISVSDQIARLMNDAAETPDSGFKVEFLMKAKELLIYREPQLIDSFHEEMLAFQYEGSEKVQKFVISFIEASCAVDLDLIPKVIGSLSSMLRSDYVSVLKRTILGLAVIYKLTIKWIAQMKNISAEAKSSWTFMSELKRSVIDMLDSENDGIRSHVIKFLETVVVALTPKSEESEEPKEGDAPYDILQIPETHPILKIKRLKEEGRRALDAILKYLNSSHISSMNLQTAMSSLTRIARQRPNFMGVIIQAFEALHVNLPPTLARSQVSSVRKSLKMQLLQLLKLPSAVDSQYQIATLLTDLGATQAEVMRAVPHVAEATRKRKQRDDAAKEAAKRLKEEEEEEDGTSPLHPSSSKEEAVTKESIITLQEAIDLTAQELVPRLTAANVADLVLLSMVTLPDEMPPQFCSTYTPIAAAGSDAQVQHVARLLATQLTSSNLGPGAAKLRQQQLKVEEADTSPAYDGSSSPNFIAVVNTEEKPVVLPVAQPLRKPSVRQFNVAAVTRHLDMVEADRIADEAYSRIISADKAAASGGAAVQRIQMLTGLATQFRGRFAEILLEFILSDLKQNQELAFSWLYKEYAAYKAFNLSEARNVVESKAQYNVVLSQLLQGLMQRPDHKEGLFSRLLLEAPWISPGAVEVLKYFCQDESRVYFGMATLRDIILKRPTLTIDFLTILLDFTAHQKPEVRNNALRVVKVLSNRADLTNRIETHALTSIHQLLSPHPPATIFGEHTGRPEVQSEWSEDSINSCLYLLMDLLPSNHMLIQELASVYTKSTSVAKRCILRVVETPVRAMGMDSPQLLKLVESCPKGAETLVTRLIHILTDRAAPSKILVDKVRDLYKKRVSDVRFLIPVLRGLSKEEVIDALPKLIGLTSVVVKEVIHRLLAGQGERGGSHPLSAAELMVALHNIDTSKCEVKVIIKGTEFCLAEPGVYTKEVLANVIQQLVEQSPLPMLLMRTVIKSLSKFPDLRGFVINVLQRLLQKKVWKQDTVWKGFVKCCARTKPHSFPILLQLAPTQFEGALAVSPELKVPLLTHIRQMTPHQRAPIPKAILNILEADVTENQEVLTPKARSRAPSLNVGSDRGMIKMKIEPRKSRDDRRSRDEPS